MSSGQWDVVLSADQKIVNFKLKEIIKYRDLLWLFVKRDIVTIYKQTILGPLWFVIQPILTSLMFSFVFSRVAKVSTDGLPPFLFYLQGLVVWNYFSECFLKSSTTFINNQNIFGKVYFPRIIVPISITISNLAKFGVQLLLFVAIWAYYFYHGNISPSYLLFLAPIVIVAIALFSTGLAMIFSALTTKYRDFVFLLNFGIQLLMYITPVIYPVSIVPEDYLFLVRLNPMAPLVETLRNGFFNVGNPSMVSLLYSVITSLVVFLIGAVIFSKVEKSFMDNV